MGELVQTTWHMRISAFFVTILIHMVLLYLLYIIPEVGPLSVFGVGFRAVTVAKSHSLCAISLHVITPKNQLSSVVVPVLPSSKTFVGDDLTLMNVAENNKVIVSQEMSNGGEGSSLVNVVDDLGKDASVGKDMVMMGANDNDRMDTVWYQSSMLVNNKTKKRRISLAHVARGFMSYVNDHSSSRIVTCGIELQCNQKQFSHRARIALSFYEEQMASFIVQLGNEHPYNGMAPMGSFVQALVKLTSDGVVEQVSMLQGSGYSDFDKHTLSVLSQATGRYPLLPSITGLSVMVIVVRFFCGVKNNGVATISQQLGNT